MWQAIEVTGGVVRSRDARALGVGEMVTASNVRLKPGDNVQVHNDVGTEAFGAPVNTVVAGPFYLSFESSADKLLCVTTDGSTNSYLETATVGATGTWASIQTITGVVTAASVVHRGDQYFVGTDQGNYVVQDNVARLMGMVAVRQASGNVVSVSVSSNNGTEQYDYFVYAVTEYDSVNDVESEIIRFDIGPVTTDNYDLEVNWPTTAQNATTDKVRIYRHFVGNSGNDVASDAVQQAVAIINDKFPFTGGLLIELDYDYVDADAGAYHYTDKFTGGKYDPSIQYPLIATDVVYGGSIFSYLKQVREFTLGCVFNDCLVVNDPATSKQIIRYSPPGYPEYQPDPYFMYFATDRSDEIVGMHSVAGRLIVLTTGGAHRVNYLPLAGDIVGQQGRVQEVIASKAGCVGRNAHAKVQTSQGELVVWLSKRGLEWTNGGNWDDACPDFVGSLVTGSSPVLVNNESLYRLELYDGTTRWDFYYHPSHAKGGKLKLMGPSTVPASVAKGACSNEDYAWVGAASSVYTVNVGTSAEDSVLLTGHIGVSPFMDLVCDGLGVTHSGTVGSSYVGRIYGKLDGAPEVATGPGTVPNPELDETGRTALAMRGRYLRAEMTVSGDVAWAAGPLWLEAIAEDGPNG